MKLQLARTVPAPIDRVWDEYTKPGNRCRWDTTLTSYEPIQGKPGFPGSLAHVTYMEAGVTIETTEWVVERTAPIVYRAVYDAPIGVLRVDNRFSQAAEGTVWTLSADLRLKSFGLKLLSPFLRTKLREQLEGDMENFSEYLTGPDNRESRVSGGPVIGSGQTL